MSHSQRLFIAATALTTLSACAQPERYGYVEFYAWGEDFIEIGIPAEAMADGWAVEFSRFEIETAEIYIADTWLSATGPFDLSLPSGGEERGRTVGLLTVPTGDYDDTTFTITRVTIEGSASKDGVEKSFSWVFDEPTRYEGCEVVTEVREDQFSTFEITVHADHLFYDSLVAEDPALRFEALAAADTDDDGEITVEELAATDIGAYDPGNLEVDDLWAFLAAQARTLGHANGESHCAASPA